MKIKHWLTEEFWGSRREHTSAGEGRPQGLQRRLENPAGEVLFAAAVDVAEQVEGSLRTLRSQNVRGLARCDPKTFQRLMQIPSLTTGGLIHWAFLLRSAPKSRIFEKLTY